MSFRGHSEMYNKQLLDHRLQLTEIFGKPKVPALDQIRMKLELQSIMSAQGKRKRSKRSRKASKKDENPINHMIKMR